MLFSLRPLFITKNFFKLEAKQANKENEIGVKNCVDKKKLSLCWELEWVLKNDSYLQFYTGKDVFKYTSQLFN